MKTKREAVIAKIREANPETMELSFGCEVYVKNGARVRVIGIDGRVVFFTRLVNSLNTDFIGDITIVGHPLHPHHLLIALQKDGCNLEKRFPMGFSPNSIVFYFEGGTKAPSIINLTNFQHQLETDDELIEKLYEILIK